MGKLVIERDNEHSEPPAVLEERWSLRNTIGQEVFPVLWTWITLTLITQSHFLLHSSIFQAFAAQLDSPYAFHSKRLPERKDAKDKVWLLSTRDFPGRALG